MVKRTTLAVRRVAAILGRPFRWWSSLDPAERILYRAVVLSAVGFGMIALPLGFIVPAALFALVFFGFSLRRAA